MILYRKIKKELGFEPYMNAFVYQIYIPMLLLIWVRSLESGLENKFIWGYSILIYFGLKIYQIITRRVNGSNKRMIVRGIWVQGIYFKVYKKLFLLQLIEKKLFYEKKIGIRLIKNIFIGRIYLVLNFNGLCGFHT